MRRPLSLEENIRGLPKQDAEYNIVLLEEQEESPGYCLYCHYSLSDVHANLQKKGIDYSDKKICTRCGLIYKRVNE